RRAPGAGGLKRIHYLVTVQERKAAEREFRSGAAVHFDDDLPQPGAVSGGKDADFFDESLTTQSPNLIHRNLGRPPAAAGAQAAAPAGVQPGGDRACDNGFQVLVQHIEADDDHGTRLRHLATSNRIERSQIDSVAGGDHRSSPSSPSPTAASKGANSSPFWSSSAAIARAVSS